MSENYKIREHDSKYLTGENYALQTRGSRVSGTIAAYSITGAALLGAGGYLAGFSGGMLHSNGDWGYSHQSGIIGAQIGSSIGLVLGSFVGIIEGYESPKSPVLPNLQGQNEQSYSSTNNLGTPIPELSSELFLDAEFKGYYFGAKVYEHNIFSGGAGICLPPFGIGVGPGVYNSQSPYNRTLLAHEFGHWLQFHNWGSISYYLIVAPASLYFAQTRNKYGWTEIDANRRAYDFHQKPSWWHDWFPLQTP